MPEDQAKLEKFPELAPVVEHLQQVQDLVAGARRKTDEQVIPIRVMYMNDVVHRALQPDIQSALRAEILAFAGSVHLEDVGVGVIRLAKRFKSSYFNWLPEVPMCEPCKVPMFLS